MNAQIKKWASIGERLLKSFAVSFIGVYVAGGLSIARFADASVLEKAADAGLAAVGSLVLSLLGTNIGNTNTPSLLPRRLDPTTKPAAAAVIHVDDEEPDRVPDTPMRAGAVNLPDDAEPWSGGAVVLPKA